MSATPDLAERVRLFVAEAAGVSADRVGLDTRIEDGLGVSGDDVADLLNAFAERFGVDLSGLQVDRHVGSEGLPFLAGLALCLGTVGLVLLWMWAWWAALLAVPLIVIVWRRQAPNPCALRVRHLVIAAEMGRWDDAAMGLPEIVD